MSTRQLKVRFEEPINGPNYNEFERLEALKFELERRHRLFPKNEYVSVPRETIEELIQMMSDSLRTAKQILANDPLASEKRT